MPFCYLVRASKCQKQIIWCQLLSYSTKSQRHENVLTLNQGNNDKDIQMTAWWCQHDKRYERKGTETELTSTEGFRNELVLLERLVHQRGWIKFWRILNIRWLSSIVGEGMIVLVTVVALRNIAILISISTSTGSTGWSWCCSSKPVCWNTAIC